MSLEKHHSVKKLLSKCEDQEVVVCWLYHEAPLFGKDRFRGLLSGSRETKSQNSLAEQGQRLDRNEYDYCEQQITELTGMRVAKGKARLLLTANQQCRHTAGS